ncbi:hypothetical protein KC363_g7388 [Hortaea werneckii]|uniref:Cytochrome P450 n=1 Tax=Hortaea werneckii TaxID=91943 RepID=A0A3M7EYL1_HORWE|nr:hypothetical protein KC325_g6745 [Hortaea werneckii]KAI6988068.1 hypothetical protein KC359_g7965 [Hortaea werneckii]KAI7141918.1 hypothetical protein KC344_g7602 [Hortaea werneckii]KAI7169193.1 hypothetical protein KC360_g7633 [Hortaea werneckii]KAI7185026.1 hypothetical protein KC363_g7388 [Hortaea werneckii]
MALLVYTTATLLLYLLALAVHRLYLSPLAKSKIPGPRLGALTKFYEAYYEIVQRGKFAFKLDDLHERYGPIIRITPDEVHIKDSSFWDELFVKHPKASRYSSTASRFGNDDSMFSVADAGYHRMLRAPLNPFFSRRAIIDQQSLVQEKCNKMLEGMTKLKDIGTVFKVTDAFAAFAGDVISQYSFGFSYGLVNNYETGWSQNFHDAYLSLGAFGHVAVQYPWVNNLLKAIPERLVLRMDPSLGQMLQLQKDFVATIDDIKQSAKSPEQRSPLRTMFHALLDSELPEYAKTITRLEHEAQTVIGGGIVTTAWALTQSVFYILNDPTVYKRLADELHQAIPDANSSDAFAYEKLERLPYLTGCVKEGIRFSYGISGRLPRVFHEAIQYREYTIPAGTAIAMSIRDVNFDDSIYDEPRNFKPERWTAVNRSAMAADRSSLESHFVTFGRGPRMCLGINLAYMELYIVLAQIFRRLVLELHNTDESDVELAHDFFLPSPKLDSKGVRVMVVGTQSWRRCSSYVRPYTSPALFS